MSRRGENIFKRKDGRWEGRYRKGKTMEGKTLYGSVYARTYKSVKEKLELKKTETGIVVTIVRPLSFREMAEDWLSSIQMSVKESTLVKYRNLLNRHILVELGQRNVAEITTKNIEDFVYGKICNGRLDGTGGLSRKTVKDMLCVIRKILEHAERNGAMLSGSAANIHIKNTDHILQIISHENQDLLEQYLVGNESFRNTGILICLYMGLRIGEICALKWENILLQDKIIRIRFTMQRVQDFSEDSGRKTKVIVTSPKSESSFRDIPIPDFLVDILKRNEITDREAYFLTGSSKCFLEPRAYQAYFSRLLIKNQIPHMNFHSLRHAFATRCIEEGVDPKTLSEVLGHSTVNTTLARYVHITMDMKRKNIEKIAKSRHG